MIIDLRSEHGRIYSLSPLQSVILDQTESVTGRGTVLRNTGASVVEFKTELDQLVAAGLVIEEDNALLALSNEWDESFSND